MARGRNDSGASEIVATLLTVGMAVVLSGAVTLALFALPGPQAEPHTAVQSFVLPANPTQLVVEQEGGRAIPLANLLVIVNRNGTPTNYVVGPLLQSKPTVWADRTVFGVFRKGTDSFQPGDQVLYNSSKDSAPGSTFQRTAISVSLVDTARGGVIVAGSGVSLGGSSSGTGGQPGAGPTFSNLTSPPQARTTSRTTFTVNFTTPLYTVSRSDFLLSGFTITGANLTGSGASATFSVTPNFSSFARPTLTTVASPSGTKDLFGNPLQGGKSVVLADMLPPGISNVVATVTGGTTATITWTTDEPATSGVLYGPAPGLYGLSAANPVNCWAPSPPACPLSYQHSVALTSLSSVSKYYFEIVSTDNQSTTATALGNFTTPFINGPTFTTPTIHLLYVAVEYKSTQAYVAVNIINPTSTPLTLTHVYVNSSPTIGGGSSFFNSATVGQNSDPQFGNCGWAAAQTSNSLVCTPASFTVPGGQMRQVVIGFTTAALNSASYTILIANATFANAAPAVSNYWNVLHTGGTVSSANEVILLPWNPQTSQFRGNLGNVTGGSPQKFYFDWQSEAGATSNVAIFYVPAGWTNLTVPAQAALAGMTVKVVQPTTTSQGSVEVGLNLPGGGSNTFYFQATPPPHAGISIVTVDERSDTSGSGEIPAPALFLTGAVVQ
jgi:flagellin-like protein